tara:strand:- start:1290 stop:1859 length:570 start_codon:yes stop_codon:yes gene_type:complete
MKYKDLVKNLPYELQDKIYDLVFNDIKNIIKNVIKSKNNSLIYNYSINKVIKEFDFYYVPLKLMCCLYSDLNDIVYKFKNDEEKKIYIPYNDIFYYVFHQQNPPEQYLDYLLIFDYSNNSNKNTITKWDLINCYMKSFKDIFEDYANILGINMSQIKFNFQDYLILKEISLIKKENKLIIKGKIDGVID